MMLCVWNLGISIDKTTHHIPNNNQYPQPTRTQRAYEIAFATAYLFGGARPSFYEGACVDFVKMCLDASSTSMHKKPVG